ncbi:hypothetical protein [Burkholderia sp. Bp9012]|uniref:hypothetical protein n=1 Tax=Burkholderia sp. Bp9012 TaxID=2184562 RepID=UPI000F5B4525|nr:hypothetical protein [Burkholderia sp. Bp9012]
MGMDVFGKAPTSKVGRYFRSNVWCWHPLWRYCEKIAPDIIPRNNLGHSNDGWGLDARGASALAERLARALASGETAQYERAHEAALAALPLVPCTICGGTGNRAEPPHVGPGPLHCNGCDGEGRTPHFSTYYHFSTEFLGKFEMFLRHCGGFKII